MCWLVLHTAGLAQITPIIDYLSVSLSLSVSFYLSALSVSPSLLFSLSLYLWLSPSLCLSLTFFPYLSLSPSLSPSRKFRSLLFAVCPLFFPPSLLQHSHLSPPPSLPSLPPSLQLYPD